MELRRPEGRVGVPLSRKLVMIIWVTAKQMSGQRPGNPSEVELGERGIRVRWG